MTNRARRERIPKKLIDFFDRNSLQLFDSGAISYRSHNTVRSESARAGRRGFALVTVIWGLAIIALLVVSFMTTARLQLQTAYNLANATRADLLADAAIGATFIALMAERETAGPAAGANARQQRPAHDGAPRLCALDGAAVAVAVEEETGKLDLNGASPNILRAALVGFGLDARDAEAIADAIVDFRTPPQARPPGFAPPPGDRPFPPKNALFQSALELDQVAAMTPQLFSALLPFVTVHSRSPGVDRRAAAPALFGALAGYPPEEVQALRLRPFPNAIDRDDPRFPPAFNQVVARGAVLAHVEVMLPSGQSGLREAIFDLNDGRGPAFALRERRRGVARYLDALRLTLQSGGVGLPDC
jgi:general secretion pathway protein K